VSDKGKVTKAGVKDRLKALEDEAESDDERDALIRCLELIEAESDIARVVKEAQDALDEMLLARYAKLTEAQIKTLIPKSRAWGLEFRVSPLGSPHLLARAGIEPLDEAAIAAIARDPDLLAFERCARPMMVQRM